MDISQRRQIIRKLRLNDPDGYQEYNKVLLNAIYDSLQEMLYELESQRDLRDTIESYILSNFYEISLSDTTLLRLFEFENEWERVSCYAKSLLIVAQVSLVDQYTLREARMILYDLFQQILNSTNSELIYAYIWDDSQLFRNRTMIFSFLRKKIADLPEGNTKKVLEMWIKGFSVRRAARELQLSENTIVLYKHRGFAYLRENLFIFLGGGI